ncbi:MAG TPA: hypothetical protein VFC65_05955 [Prolixibacteraceae bacterium]|nr:hypothetical protein [Prolixibacteraceae bacterium]
MKQILSVFILLFATTCSEQDTEFAKYSNGLIYSDTIINQLRYIVDSLNVKFKVSDSNKTYLSRSQAKGHFLSLKTGKIKEAIKDIESNISFDAFERKYRKSEIKKELLVVQARYYSTDKTAVVRFTGMDLINKMEERIYFTDNLSVYDAPLKGKWIYNYSEQDEYDPECLDAFYLLEEFSQRALPEYYARMIRYSDCLIDTLAQENNGKTYVSDPYRDNTPPKVSEFLDYVWKLTNKPDPDDTVDFDIKYQLWDSLRISRVNGIYKNDEKFKRLLNDAVKVVLDSGGSDNKFEEYVELFNSKKNALELKRTRTVVGSCSQDEGPRIHAFKIAELAAETMNWDVFIRSHLDLMNDWFRRTSDGTYAWGRRQTYIKELEALGINVQDLIMGISLYAANPSQNHYYGNISRLGRALTEATQSKEIEEKILQIISDPKLDTYNRISFFYLFLNYTYNLSSEEERSINMERLDAAIKTLPSYLASKRILE